ARASRRRIPQPTGDTVAPRGTQSWRRRHGVVSDAWTHRTRAGRGAGTPRRRRPDDRPTTDGYPAGRAGAVERTAGAGWGGAHGAAGRGGRVVAETARRAPDLVRARDRRRGTAGAGWCRCV